MDQSGLPAVNAVYLIKLVKRWKVSAKELLSGLGIRQELLGEPHARLSVPVATQLFERARLLTGEPAIGIYLGLQARISSHGYLGFAALSASTMREGIDLTIQFMPMLTTALSVRLRVEGRDASLIVEEHADFGSARDILLLALLIGISQLGEALSGQRLPGYADLALPTPPYMAKLEGMGARIRFNQPAHRLFFDKALLDLPYVMADPTATRLAREQCERQLNSLGFGGRLLSRVRGLIPKSNGGFRSLEEVATHLHLSPRTLKRQLASEGASYSTLLEQERHERALLLLRSPGLSMEHIAARLGYSNVANFARAFRRWTDRTPADYRRSPS